MDIWNTTTSSAFDILNSHPVKVSECRDVHRQNDSDKCSFVNSTGDCHLDGGFFDYTIFIYCALNSHLVPLAIFILFFWLVFLFVALGVSADDFFCPSLVVIARTLRLSDNIAGVTLLAFGNGAPDVFSAIAAIRGSKNGDVSLALGALLGAGVFITTVVAGSVCIAKPFKMMERPFFRDVIFYLATVYMTFYILCDGRITLVEALCFILFYVAYVVVVIVARLVYQRRKRRREAARHNRHLQGLVSSLSTSSAVSDTGLPTDVDDVLDRPIYTANHPTAHHLHNAASQPCASNSIYNEIDENTPLLNDDGGGVEVMQSDSAFKDFLHAISPIDLVDWKHRKVLGRIVAVIKGIAKFILRLTVPVVDYNAAKHNWNRHLNCLHCITGPLVAMYLVRPDFFLHYIHETFPVWAVVLISGVTLATVVFFTSRNNHSPIYHWAFAYMGFGIAVVWIQSIATEVVNILQTFGVVFDINNAILGLTLLAMGNSIADLIADVTLARQGFPRTGISACYGGPMFNLLLGIGIPFTIKCLKDGSIEMTLSVIQLVLITSLFTILSLSLVVVPFVLKFQMTRNFGFFLYGLYVVFILIVVLVETGVIKDTHFHWCNMNG